MEAALRALLIQSGKKLLEVNNPLQKWGLTIAARRGRNKAAVAVARKLRGPVACLDGTRDRRSGATRYP